MQSFQFHAHVTINLPDPITQTNPKQKRFSPLEKIAQVLNECTVVKFSVHNRSVRDHMGIIGNKHKRKIRAEEKASGIAPDEPSELDNLLDNIVALEESADAESQELRAEKSEKFENN